MMSKCRKWHLMEPKFAKFPGEACPQTSLEVSAFGARVSTSGAKKYLPKNKPETPPPPPPSKRFHPTDLQWNRALSFSKLPITRTNNRLFPFRQSDTTTLPTISHTNICFPCIEVRKIGFILYEVYRGITYVTSTAISREYIKLSNFATDSVVSPNYLPSPPPTPPGIQNPTKAPHLFFVPLESCNRVS